MKPIIIDVEALSKHIGLPVEVWDEEREESVRASIFQIPDFRFIEFGGDDVYGITMFCDGSEVGLIGVRWEVLQEAYKEEYGELDEHFLESSWYNDKFQIFKQYIHWEVTR